MSRTPPLPQARPEAAPADMVRRFRRRRPPQHRPVRRAWHAGGTPEMLSQGYAKVEQYGKEYVRDPDSIAVTRRGDGIGRRETA